MSEYKQCVICDEWCSAPGSNIHDKCHALIKAGLLESEARAEYAKAELYAQRMEPLLMKAANRTAVNAVAYFFVTCLMLGIIYAVLHSM